MTGEPEREPPRDVRENGRDEPISTPAVRIPAGLLPADGRFGCGPSKVRPEAVAALAAAAPPLPRHLATARPTVRDVVGSLRAGLAELFALPDGYEVVLGNGGTTVVLGRGHLRPRSSGAASTSASASSPPSSPRRRPPRRSSTSPRSSSAALRDPPRAPGPMLTSTCTPSPTTRPRPAWRWPLRAPGGRGPRQPRGGRRHRGGGRAALGPRRGRRLLLRPPEVPRLRRRAVAGLLLAGRAGAHRAHRRVGPLDPRVARPRHRRSRTPAWTRPTTRPRWPPCSSPTGRSAG